MHPDPLACAMNNDQNAQMRCPPSWKDVFEAMFFVSVFAGVPALMVIVPPILVWCFVGSMRYILAAITGGIAISAAWLRFFDPYRDMVDDE
jgi:hypothetical protein